MCRKSQGCHSQGEIDRSEQQWRERIPQDEYLEPGRFGLSFSVRLRKSERVFMSPCVTVSVEG
jgi:hypothetical protein